MNDCDKNFIDTFNECYPFERYIFKTPKVINDLFDDVFLTEIFVPYTEIKPILNDDSPSMFTCVDPNEVYVKLQGKAGEMRFAYFDFEEHIRENIRDAFIEDFGGYNYESLYIDHEDDNDELNQVFEDQFNRILSKYGECNPKQALRDNLLERII